MSASGPPVPPHRLARAAACLAVAGAILAVPVPAGVTPAGWRLLAFFAAVIAGFVLRPLSMGPLVLVGLAAASSSRSLSMEAALSGYGDPVVWLVVGAFLLAGSVARTGLGSRIALMLVSRLGRSTLGLGYAICAAELVLGPVVPSNTARGGGILAPIVDSLSRALGSTPSGDPRRAGAFLSLVGAHANLVTSAMFLTGMAANPLVTKASADVLGVRFEWGTWALGAAVPGLLGLALLPLLLNRLAPPTLADARAARERARADLAAKGPWSRRERVLAVTLATLLLLWATKPLHGLDTTLVAWLGVCALLVSGTESWEDMVGDPRTWDTLVWLGGLLALANGLRDGGVIAWFAREAQGLAAGRGPVLTAVLLAVVYFYSMYGFSMLTAHISAMTAAFFAVAAAAGAPALLVVPLMAYFSNLCACTTNYSTGPVILYYGLGYVPASTWFRAGFVVSLFHLAVWLGAGLAWWKVLGWW